jgi:uncharacterized Zn finger protein
MRRRRRGSYDYDYGYGSGFPPYVPVAERRRKAAREMAKLEKKGRVIYPVVIEGRAIARTFWGKAWCDNLERYGDFANRIPRGRTYVRNGSVVDLQIGEGEVNALVSGSSIYEVHVKVAAVPKATWKAIRADCSGAIDSLVELLQGRFSKGVMERLCQQRTGLFPSPGEIQFACSCPDWASMCKHVAAVLYGVGARLDERPELLFRLRKVDEKELIAVAGRDLPLSRKGPAADRVLAADDLSALFGVEIAAPDEKTKAVKTGRARAEVTDKAAALVSTGLRRKGAPPPVEATKPARVKTVKRGASSYPKCEFPGCDRNRFPRGRGYCGEHWRLWKAGQIPAPGGHDQPALEKPTKQKGGRENKRGAASASE